MPRPFLSFHHTPRLTLPLVSVLLAPAFSLTSQAEVTDGTFKNEEDGVILWESEGDLLVSDDGEAHLFSSIFLESWTSDASNLGEIRASGLHRLVLSASDSSIGLTGVHLGGREKEEEDKLLTFTNSGTVSANWSGDLGISGSGNDIRITGVHLEELELLDNDGLIEAVFDGTIEELAPGNQLDVTGVRSDAETDIFNFEDGVIRAAIEGTGTIADGAVATATGIESAGELALDNRGTIEAIVGDGLTPETSGTSAPTSATGIFAGDGVAMTNRAGGEILARNHGSGTATGISIVLQEETPVDSDNDDDNGDEEEPPEPRRSQIVNQGTISARAGEGGDAAAIVSDGNLTVSNSGTIEAGGIILSDEDAEEIETADVASAIGIHVQNGEGNITNSGTISAKNGFAVRLENGGSLTNTGKIIGDVFLGDGDATLTINPNSEFDGDVDGGSGTNTLELSDDGNPFQWGQGEYAGEFENFSKLLVNAGGTFGTGTIWTLTGDQEYADGTTIRSGALISNDVLTSDISIEANGTFISSGSVIGDIVNSGGLLVGSLDEDNAFIAPEGGAILQVDGDVSFENGSYLQVIAGETSLDATGNVVIGSQDPENENTETPVLILVDADWDQDYTVLRAGGTLEGEFDGGYGFILLDINYDNPEDVTARLGIHRDAIREAGETSNERSLARVLAGLDPVAGSDLETAFREFAEIGNADNFGIIVPTMNGEILASGAAAHSSFNRTLRQTVVNQVQYRPNRYDNRFAPYPGASMDEIFQPEQNLWARTLGIRGDLDRPGDAGDTDYRLYGVVTGYDRVRTEDARAGIAVAFGDTNVSQNRDDIDGNVYQVLLYATKHTEGYLYDATLGYGYHDMKSERYILPSDSKATASYDAHEIFGSIQASMYLQEEGVLILPMAGIDFTHFRQGSFRESGPWGLSGGSTDFTSVRPFIGVRILGEHLTGGGGTVVPEIRFRYSHELLDRDVRISSRFVGDTSGNSFSTTGAEFNSGEFEMGAGVMIQPGGWERFSIFADYDFSLQRQHAISAGFSYAF